MIAIWITLLSGGLLFADPAVVYREIFPNGSGADADMTGTGWRVHAGDQAVPLSGQTVRLSGNPGAPRNLEPIQSDPTNKELVRGFLFNHDIGRSQLLWTDEVSVQIPQDRMIGISWYQSSDAGDPVHLAVRVDGVWYASARTFSSNASYQKMDVAFSADEWRKLDFVENSTLTLGSAARPSGSKIGAVGFFVPKLTAKLRLDTVEIQTGEESVAAVETLPEPGTLLKGFVHPPVIFYPGEEYGSEARKYQGIPTIERTPGGRLWAAWYAGPVGEDLYNYMMAATSGDDGKSWSDLKLVVDPDGTGPLRASDPCLWLDPNGKLWLFWWMNGTFEGNELTVTMAVSTSNPDDENPVWTEPEALFPGVMINKPIVTSKGEWLMPAAIWHQDNSCRVMVSTDQGKTWALRGTANVPKARRQCDEEMMVERKDGSLWMLVRTADYGIGRSVSTDNGKTWTEVQDYLHDATSRFHLRRLKSGNLLLIKHGPLDQRIGRKDLTAYLSTDDGKTWKGGLLIDERSTVSYPDATQAPDGTIYAIYDWNRADDKNILMTTFTEKDVLAAAYLSDKARSRVLINQATGINPKPWLKKPAPVELRTNADGAALRTGSPAAFVLPAEESGTAQPGNPVFSNRSYRFSDEFPACLRGKQISFSPLEKTSAVCSKAGTAYVITPSPGRNKDSVEAELLVQGFAKTDIPEFILFLMPNGERAVQNACSVYQKEVKAGEVVEFGKWGVLVF